MKSIFESRAALELLHHLYKEKSANVQRISKVLDIAYSHAHFLVRYLEEKKLIKSKKISRELVITPTEEGLKIGKLVGEIKKILGE